MSSNVFLSSSSDGLESVAYLTIRFVKSCLLQVPLSQRYKQQQTTACCTETVLFVFLLFRELASVVARIESVVRAGHGSDFPLIVHY